jgi:hypothetical protein
LEEKMKKNLVGMLFVTGLVVNSVVEINAWIGSRNNTITMAALAEIAQPGFVNRTHNTTDDPSKYGYLNSLYAALHRYITVYPQLAAVLQACREALMDICDMDTPNTMIPRITAAINALSTSTPQPLNDVCVALPDGTTATIAKAAQYYYNRLGNAVADVSGVRALVKSLFLAMYQFFSGSIVSTSSSGVAVPQATTTTVTTATTENVYVLSSDGSSATPVAATRGTDGNLYYNNCLLTQAAGVLANGQPYYYSTATTTTAATTAAAAKTSTAALTAAQLKAARLAKAKAAAAQK